jgi:hypothetical protein
LAPAQESQESFHILQEEEVLLHTIKEFFS